MLCGHHNLDLLLENNAQFVQELFLSEKKSLTTLIEDRKIVNDQTDTNFFFITTTLTSSIKKGYLGTFYHLKEDVDFPQ